MPENPPHRVDQLARLAATKGVSRRQILKATVASCVASTFLGFPRLHVAGKGSDFLASADAQLFPPHRDEEECNNPIFGTACMAACLAAAVVCADECEATLGAKCVACAGGVERCLSTCSKELDCHCRTGVACRDRTTGTPYGPAQCCHPDEECTGVGCVPACHECEHRDWLGACVNECASGQGGVGELLGTSCCKGECVDTQNDGGNCGACGRVCQSGARCDHGVCKCFDGDIECDAICTNPLLDYHNCGLCGHVCKSNETCMNGQCVAVCPPGCTSDCCPIGWVFYANICVDPTFTCQIAPCSDAACCQSPCPV